jgi:hypothetical protein
MLFACSLLFLLVLSCANENEIKPNGELSLGKLTENGPILSVSAETLHGFFLERFATSEVTLVEVREYSKKYYLYAEGLYNGSDAFEGQPIVMRWELGEKDGKIDFKSKLDTNNKSFSFGESCTGDPSSKCKFDSGGGCTCDRGSQNSKCNHTITKEDEL